MMHAIDARTGYEVWAFIPYNLLPKLKTFRDGQAVDQFDYFVDSSPKIAEVKINGAWRSLLLFGEGPGGIFYQTFDVTEAGMGVAPELDDIGAVNSMLAQFDTPNESIVFKWAFPNYDSFDPTYSATFTVTDGTPGGKQRLYGDLKATASFAEKTVGFTWSDPAVGALTADRSLTAVIVGSGYFPDIEASIPNRGASAPKAGTRYICSTWIRECCWGTRRRFLYFDFERVRLGLRMRRHRRRRGQRKEERTTGRPDRGRRERFGRRVEGIPGRHRRQILAIHVHAGRRRSPPT